MSTYGAWQMAMNKIARVFMQKFNKLITHLIFLLIIVIGGHFTGTTWSLQKFLFWPQAGTLSSCAPLMFRILSFFPSGN